MRAVLLVLALTMSGSSALAEGEAERVKKAYESFDSSKMCREGRNCDRGLREAAGIDVLPHGPYDPVKMFNPRAGMPNPDPEWITGWDSLPAGDGYNDSEKTFKLMAAAAVQKEARRGCLQGFKEKIYPQFLAADERLGKAIDAALAQSGEHDRLAGLLALRASPEAKSLEGARFRLEREIASRLTTPGARAAWQFERLAMGDKGAQLRPTLDIDSEANAYCADRLASLREPGVRPPFTKEERDAARKALADASTYQAPEAPAREPQSINDYGDYKAPFLGRGGLSVTAVTASKKGQTVTAEWRKEEQMVLGCKQTKERVVFENGKAQYDKNCTYGVRTVISVLTLTLADLPSGGLKKGDELRVYFEVKDFKAKTAKPSAKREIVTQSFAGEGALIAEVKRAGAKVFSLAP